MTLQFEKSDERPDTNHDDWIEWRLDGIGGSDVAAAYSGLYGGAYKAVAVRIGVDVDEIPAEYAERGKRWEGPIADGIIAHTGLYVGGEQMWLQHADRPRHRCTPDGFLFDTPEPTMDDALAGLEIKTRFPHAPWPWHYWITQCQWGMYVTGLPRWLLVIATIDSELDQPTGALTAEAVADVKYRWVYADELMQANLVDLADELLGYVDAGRLPPPTSADALPYVKAANAEADATATADIDDLADLISRYEELKQAEKAAKEERVTAEAVIRDRMGEATEALTSDGRWRVRCGVPVRKFTVQSEVDFLEVYGPKHPELIIETLNRDLAKSTMPDEYDDFRLATRDRRLTIKNMEE